MAVTGASLSLSAKESKPEPERLGDRESEQEKGSETETDSLREQTSNTSEFRLAERADKQHVRVSPPFRPAVVPKWREKF